MSSIMIDKRNYYDGTKQWESYKFCKLNLFCNPSEVDITFSSIFLVEPLLYICTIYAKIAASIACTLAAFCESEVFHSITLLIYNQINFDRMSCF